MPKILIGVILVLVVVAAGLGVAIVNKYHPIHLSWFRKNETKQQQVDDQKNLTADEKILLNTPPANSPEDVLKTRYNLADRYSQVTNTIVVNNCTANPEVIKQKYGSTITIDNQGTKDIHFGFGNNRILIAAGKSAQVVANFSNGPGLYGYGCDDPTVTRGIGLILLTQ